MAMAANTFLFAFFFLDIFFFFTLFFSLRCTLFYCSVIYYCFLLSLYLIISKARTKKSYKYIVPSLSFFRLRVIPFSCPYGCKFRPLSLFHIYKCSFMCVQSVGGHTRTQTRAQIVTGAGVDSARNYRVQMPFLKKEKKEKRKK